MKIFYEVIDKIEEFILTKLDPTVSIFAYLILAIISVIVLFTVVAFIFAAYMVYGMKAFIVNVFILFVYWVYSAFRIDPIDEEDYKMKEKYNNDY